MIIEVHTIRNYGPANLNRDDTGSPKNCMFGGVLRGRISSQCKKKNIREYPGFTKLMDKNAQSIRTRQMPELIGKGLAERGVDDAYITIAKKQATEFWEKEGKENKDGKYTTAQIVAFSSTEIEQAVQILYDAIQECEKPAELKKKTKDILSKLQKSVQTPMSLDIALAGRMVTAKAYKNVEASLQVAHAITTNRLVQESDYYTAVDDLISGNAEDLGAGMIGDTDYNSSCYYEYYMLNVDQLKENLKNNVLDGITISDIVKELLKAIAYTNPTGKQNSFAAHELPRAILIECKEDPVPVSYANAFVKPINATKKRNLVEGSVDALYTEMKKVSQSYGLDVSERLWFTMEEDVNVDSELAKEYKAFPEMLDVLGQKIQ